MSSINCIEITRKGEIRNERNFKLIYENRNNINMNYFSYEDFYIFLESILNLNIKFSIFYSNKLNQKSFQYIIDKFQNDNNLTALELYRASNLDLEKINNLDYFFNTI